MTAKKKPTRKAAKKQAVKAVPPAPAGPRISDQARKQEIKNILQRLKDGARITDRERDLIDQYDREGNAPDDKMLVSGPEVATILGVSKETVYSLDRKGIFERKANRFHIPETVQSYLRYKRLGNLSGGEINREQVKAETEVAKRDLTQAQADFQRRRVEVFSGQYIMRAEVETALEPVFADLVERLRANFERELPPWAVGKSAPEIKRECQHRLDEAFSAVRDGSSDALAAAEAKATGHVGDSGESDEGEPAILKPGRKPEPNSRRSRRKRRHATEGKPAAGRKPKISQKR